MIATEAEHVRDLVREYASKERHLGQAEAFHRIHRATGISERRIIELFRGRVTRVWADEFSSIVRWHDEWLARRHEQISHELALLEARRSARKDAA